MYKKVMLIVSVQKFIPIPNLVSSDALPCEYKESDSYKDHENDMLKMDYVIHDAGGGKYDIVFFTYVESALLEAEPEGRKALQTIMKVKLYAILRTRNDLLRASDEKDWDFDFEGMAKGKTCFQFNSMFEGLCKCDRIPFVHRECDKASMLGGFPKPETVKKMLDNVVDEAVDELEKQMQEEKESEEKEEKGKKTEEATSSLGESYDTDSITMRFEIDCSQD